MYRKFKSNVYIVPGSPVSLIIKCNNRAWLIDPGMGFNRADIIREVLSKLGIKEYKVLLSHSHYDHIEAVPNLGIKEVFINILETSSFIDPLVRETITYGHNPLPRFLGLNKLFFRDISINSIEYPPPKKIDCLELLDLRGHSPGLLGLKLGDDSIFLADSLFGDRLLKRVGIPYHLDLYMALHSLENTIRVFAEKGYRAILSHGPVVERKRFIDLVDMNIERIEKIIELVKELLSKNYYTLEQLTSTTLVSLGAEISLSNIYLGLVPISSVLNKLYEEPGLEYRIEEGVIKWRMKRI